MIGIFLKVPSHSLVHFIEDTGVIKYGTREIEALS